MNHQHRMPSRSVAASVVLLCSLAGCIGSVDHAYESMFINTRRSNDQIAEYCAKTAVMASDQEATFQEHKISLGMQRDWVEFLCEPHVMRVNERKLRLSRAALQGVYFPVDTRQGFVYLGENDEVIAIVVRGLWTVWP